MASVIASVPLLRSPSPWCGGHLHDVKSGHEILLPVPCQYSTIEFFQRPCGLLYISGLRMWRQRAVRTLAGFFRCVMSFCVFSGLYGGVWRPARSFTRTRAHGQLLGALP